MALYFGYKSLSSEEFDDTDLKKDISALKTGIATNNSKTKALETKMTTTETDITNIKSTNSSQNTSIQNNWVKGITNGQTADWAKNKANSNATSITQLAGRVTTVESRKKIYNYFFLYQGLTTTYISPETKFIVPTQWMHCKGLTPTSRFHLHHLIYDTDSTIPNNYIFTFQLDFFDSSSNHHTHTLGTVRKGDKVISGENILVIDTRYNLSSVTNLTSLVIARLRLKGSSNKGNEVTVSCSFEI